MNWNAEPINKGGLEIGDIVIWRWTIDKGTCKDIMCSCHTHMVVYDESKCKRDYDYCCRAISSRRYYDEREQDLLLVARGIDENEFTLHTHIHGSTQP